MRKCFVMFFVAEFMGLCWGFWLALNFLADDVLLIGIRRG